MDKPLQETEKPIDSIDLFRFDKYNLPFCILIGGLFALMGLVLYAMYRIAASGEVFLGLLLSPLLLLILLVTFFAAIPMGTERRIKIFSNRIEMEVTLYRFFEHHQKESTSHFYKDLEVFPSNSILFSGCYVVKNRTWRYPGVVTYLSPRVGSKVVSHIQTLKGDSQSQALHMKNN